MLLVTFFKYILLYGGPMNKKSISKLILYALLLTLFNMSCIVKYPEAYKNFNFNYSHKDKLQNFVLLISGLEFEDESFSESSASGFVFKTDENYIYIVTANHFCKPGKYEEGISSKELKEIGGKRIFFSYNKNYQRSVEVVKYDNENDICVMRGEKLPADTFAPVKLAKSMPKIGDTIYNVAAPSGIAAPSVVLLFDGYFGGCNETYNNSCIFTIPATMGSSGSAVYNKNGEVISIIVAALQNFNNISMGPNIIMLEGIMEENYENID